MIARAWLDALIDINLVFDAQRAVSAAIAAFIVEH
jgi:hypothetical protein